MKSDKEVILITGASRGIGTQIARRLSSKGRILYINYNKDEKGARDVAKEAEEEGADVTIVKGDVSNVKDVRNMFGSINKKHAKLDALINNATPSLKQEGILKLSWEDFQTQLDVLVKGAFYCSTEAIKIMKQKKRGHIINVLSSCVLGLPPSNMAHYVTAKYALLGLSRSLGIESSRFGIRVNMVSPYLTETDLISFMKERQLEILKEQHPMARLAEPQDTAEAVSFLLSGGASYINLANLPITGGVVT